MLSPAEARHYSLEKYYARSYRGSSGYHRRSHHRHHIPRERLGKGREPLGVKTPIPYLYASGSSILEAYTGMTPYVYAGSDRFQQRGMSCYELK